MFKLGSYIFALCIVSATASATTVAVATTDRSPSLRVELTSTLPTTVGEVSIQAFDQEKVSYQGGTYGIVKLFELGNDVVVISDTEMKAYGWCFSVNGVIPETMADQTIISGQDDVITWFYGYAHYKDGQWIAQCAVDP